LQEQLTPPVRRSLLEQLGDKAPHSLLQDQGVITPYPPQVWKVQPSPVSLGPVSSKTSRRTSCHAQKPYTRSYSCHMTQGSRNLSGKQLLKNTQDILTSLQLDRIEQNDEAYKFKGNRKGENSRLLTSIGGSPPSEHMMAMLPWVRPSFSYNKSIETCSVKSSTVVSQSPQTLKTVNSQGERTNRTRRSKSTSHSCHGT